MTTPLIFLKLGGSLITEKDKPSKARLDVIRRAAVEIAAVRSANPSLRLLLGHGSGSFAHYPAKEHNTRAGVRTSQEWDGFITVWRQAAALNRIVMDALADAGLPALAFPPSAAASARDGDLVSWNLDPIRSALQANLLPVVYGDVAFDETRGGTVLSTEDLFVYLAKSLKPGRILLAGDEAGVYSDFGKSRQIVAEITPATYPQIAAGVQGAVAVDVTGGMAGKVEAMLALVQALPECEIRIFSGLEPGNLEKALNGDPLGTWLHAS